MSAITGTVVISGNISPSDTIDTYATHVSIYGAGGLQEVLDLHLSEKLNNVTLHVLLNIVKTKQKNRNNTQ